MQIIADFHLHSKYSRAVSKDMVVPQIAHWAKTKGINLVATGDFTHPLWFRELKANLEEAAPGFYSVRGSAVPPPSPLFLLSTEVSCIYSQGGKGRRIHILIFAPSLAVVQRINDALRARGVNLMSDGRPIMGLSAKDLTEIILGVDERCLLIPAHCLLPGSYIEVNPGIKKIKDIKVGDKVLTHNGRYKKVKEVLIRPYKGSMIRVRPWYFSLGLAVTPEHPFFAIKTFKKCQSIGDICRPVGKHFINCTTRHYLKYKKEWIQASSLELGDVILFPRLRKIADKKHITISQFLKGLTREKQGGVSFGGYRKTVVPDKVLVNAGFLRLVGYYLAEGYTCIDDISFAFHEAEKEMISDVKSQMQKLFGITHCREYRRKGVKSIELIFHSKVLSGLFSKLFYEPGLPRRANAKRIPFWMLYLPPIKQKEILKAWWLGDKGYTNSQVLLNQMKTICLRLGIIPSIRVDTKEAHKFRGKHDKFDNREIKAQYDTFSLERLSFVDDKLGLSKDQVFSRFMTKLERRHGWMDDDYAYLPIRKIEKFPYAGEVYNLEVEEDNSYTSEFAAVHNCWTPWFSLYGSMSGFDSLEECFGEYHKYIYAVETGLSSDPAMNWQIEELENRSIVSFSDAHSPAKLGREATVFELPEVSFENVRKAILSENQKTQNTQKARMSEKSENQSVRQSELSDKSDSLKLRNSELSEFSDPQILYTLEFYPEEGKYHYTGHRNCNVKQSPEETKKLGTICAVCGRRLTVGVMHRVEQLARNTQDERCKTFVDKLGVKWIKPAGKKRPGYAMFVPLLEILSEVFSSGVSSQKVQLEYERLTKNLGTEFDILLHTKPEVIDSISGPKVREAIMKVRAGDIFIDPGYDGVFGTVKIWDEEKAAEKIDKKQMGLF